MVVDTVLISTSDGMIWNESVCSVNLTARLLKNKQAAISLNNEGPCADDVGLYKLLDIICESSLVEKSQIKIFTCNLLEQHPEYKIHRYPPMHFVHSAQEYSKNSSTLMPKDFKNIKRLGMFIGRSNWVRLWLASQVSKILGNDLEISYHFQSVNDFHRANVGLDGMAVWDASHQEMLEAAQFLTKCPIVLDPVKKYPILMPEHHNISKVYHKIFLELICETYFSGNTFFITEKTWRTVINRTPFILHGPVDFLKNLRKLGFRTFSSWWSEEYDSYGHQLRIEKILKLVEQIAQLPTEELIDMYHDMQEVLDHNQNLLMSLTEKDFLRVNWHD